MARVKKKPEKWVLEKGFDENYQFVSEFPSPDAIFRYIASNEKSKYQRYWMENGWTIVDYGNWSEYCRCKKVYYRFKKVEE